MVSKMVERVAKAMAKTHWPNDDRWLVYTGAAKASIEAMREPTEEMIDGCLHEDIARYKSMIDKALEE